MDKKQDPSIYAAYKRLTSALDTHGLKGKRWKKIFPETENEKKAEVAIIISDKIYFKTRTAARQRKVF